MQQYRTSDHTIAGSWDKDTWQMVDQSGNVHSINFNSVPGGAVRQFPPGDSVSINSEVNRRSYGSVASRDSGVDPDSSNSRYIYLDIFNSRFLNIFSIDSLLVHFATAANHL